MVPNVLRFGSSSVRQCLKFDTKRCSHARPWRHEQLSTLSAQPPLEEQTLLRFYEKHYYPVNVGQILNNRYKILAKLGFGAQSTVWLARDQKTNKYASVKIGTRNASGASPCANEIRVLRQMEKHKEEQSMSSLARLLTDTFQVDGHDCLVMQPYACSLQQLQNLLPGSRVPDYYLQAVALRLLACLNWLQLDCGVVHTEIIPQNVMLKTESDLLFQRAELEEQQNPSVPYIDHAHPHPQSRGQPRIAAQAIGHAVLADFGSARLVAPLKSTEGWWMPDTYRAPEVLTALPWDHAVDIWSVGIMMLELLKGRSLFGPIDRAHNQYVLPAALAQYISYMGPPPLWMIQKSKDPVIATFFDQQGNWIADPPIEERRLEDFVTAIEPGAEKTDS